MNAPPDSPVPSAAGTCQPFGQAGPAHRVTVDRGVRAVLTITKLKGAEYLIRSVADGMEDYYMGAGEAPGVWRGRWAAELGLEGVVEADALRALVNGLDPNTGVDLLAGHRERKVRAIDVTLSVPKSVSLLWAFGTPETVGGGVDRGGRGDRRRARRSWRNGPRSPASSRAGSGAAYPTDGFADRHVRAPHQPGGRPAAAHPLPDPQRGAPRRRAACGVRRRPAARVGQGRRAPCS